MSSRPWLTTVYHGSLDNSLKFWLGFFRRLNFLTSQYPVRVKRCTSIQINCSNESMTMVYHSLPWSLLNTIYFPSTGKKPIKLLWKHSGFTENVSKWYLFKFSIQFNYQNFWPWLTVYHGQSYFTDHGQPP